LPSRSASILRERINAGDFAAIASKVSICKPPARKGMKKALELTITAAVFASMALMNAGCQNTHHHSSSDGTHRMGTPKENYQMSNEAMRDGQSRSRRSGSSTEGSGTHRMGTPKENYQMSNEAMRR
jgi:hypothetical protein